MQRVLLTFWSVWFSAVFASNLGDALVQLGLVDWTFASGNYALIKQVIAVYMLPSGLAAPLFGAVIATQLAVALLFWRVAFAPSAACLRAAFAAGTALFGGFLVADEILLLYQAFPELGTTHLLVLCALLLSWLVMVDADEGECH